jgi:riboflavin kinase/FMN adenylyltransferase
MQVFKTLTEYVAGASPVLTIGTFDGVHLGHCTILNQVIRLAQEANGEAVVLTFDPHPRKVLYPDDSQLQLLTTTAEKIERLAQLGIDKVLVVPFTLEFSRLTADQFVEQYVLQTVGARHVCIGYDHRFGRNRTGGLQELQRISKSRRFSVEEIPAHQIDAANVSSTKIRKALGSGELQLANRYLGYPYRFSGRVVHGEKRGRTLGFPTANLALDPEKLVPARGVYAVWVSRAGHTGLYKGMMNIGTRPTVNGRHESCEVHLLDFDGDLYDQLLTIHLVESIRQEQRFESLDALKAQLHMDRTAVDTLLQTPPLTL